MALWGIEVKHGVSLHVDPGEDMIVHISQALLLEAALGENNGNRNEPIRLYITVGDQKLLIGMLPYEKLPHLSLKIPLERGFELSHSGANECVFFSGYKQAVVKSGTKQKNIQLPNHEDVDPRFDSSEDGEDDTQKKMIKKGKIPPALYGYGFARVFPAEKPTFREMQSVLMDNRCLTWPFDKHVWGSDLVWKGSRELYVGNIAPEATYKELSQLFSPFGKIIRFILPTGSMNQHAGYAFIKFQTRQEALNAKEALSRTHFHGRHLVLECAQNDDVKLPSIWYQIF